MELFCLFPRIGGRAPTIPVVTVVGFTVAVEQRSVFESSILRRGDCKLPDVGGGTAIGSKPHIQVFGSFRPVFLATITRIAP
jgi:hypothetical protein